LSEWWGGGRHCFLFEGEEGRRLVFGIWIGWCCWGWGRWGGIDVVVVDGRVIYELRGEVEVAGVCVYVCMYV